MGKELQLEYVRTIFREITFDYIFGFYSIPPPFSKKKDNEKELFMPEKKEKQ